MHMWGTSTLRHNFFLCSVLCSTSQQRSLAPSISVSPANQPFTGLQQARLSQQVTPTNSPNPPVMDQTNRQKSEQKEASMNRKSSAGRSQLSDTSRSSSHPIHQEGRNNARPPGHDASWIAAHHCSAEQAAAAAFGPAPAPAMIRDNSPWPSGQASRASSCA